MLDAINELQAYVSNDFAEAATSIALRPKTT